MKRLIKFTCIVLLACAVLGGGARYALSEDSPGAGPRWRQGAGMGWARFFGVGRVRLDLTAAQRQQLRGLLKAAQPTVQPLVKQLIVEQRALRDLIQGATADETAIRAQSAKLAAVQADLAVQRARLAQQGRAVLTPEQIARIGQFQAERDERVDTAVDFFFYRLQQP